MKANGEEQRDRLNDREVLRAHGLDEQRPEPVQTERVLDEHRARDQEAEDEAGDRDDRDQGVPERMLPDHATLREPPAARGFDELLLHRVRRPRLASSSRPAPKARSRARSRAASGDRGGRGRPCRARRPGTSRGRPRRRDQEDAGDVGRDRRTDERDARDGRVEIGCHALMPDDDPHREAEDEDEHERVGGELERSARSGARRRSRRCR